MASPKNLPVNFQSLKEYVLDLYPEDHSIIQGVVSEKQQATEIESLKQNIIPNEGFFFVVDMPTFAMKHCYGVQQWLGYSEKQFTLQQYWDQVVHPASKNALLLLVMEMYNMLCKGKYPLEFMVQRLASKIVVRHYNGKYLLAKKVSSVFQYDNTNRLLSYMDEFVIVGEYNNDASTDARMYTRDGIKEKDKQREIEEEKKSRFLNMDIFSPLQLQIAREMAYAPRGTTQEALAKRIKSDMGKTTFATHSNRIAEKVREFFRLTSNEIPGGVEAAYYLRKEGLL